MAVGTFEYLAAVPAGIVQELVSCPSFLGKYVKQLPTVRIDKDLSSGIFGKYYVQGVDVEHSVY